MPWRREGSCADCGECCGVSGDSPYAVRGWESFQKWSLDDINKNCPMYTLFGLTLVAEDTIGLEATEGSYRVQGRLYYYTWKNINGKGTQPLMDTSVAHDGSSYLPECPFLKPDPGDGTRPCALTGTNEDGLRKHYCRPEERADYEPSHDIWNDSSKDRWVSDHPNCSYTWVEV